MSEIDQGGFVYPQVVYEYGNEMHHAGITLRQHYAGLAMQALISTAHNPCMGGLDGYEPCMAKAAFKIADAMIEAVNSAGTRSIARTKADAVREACDKVVGNYSMCHEDNRGNVYLNITALRDYAGQIEREGGV